LRYRRAVQRYGLPFALLVFALSLTCSRQPGLKLTMLEASVQRPSNVAVYFTVDTADGEPVAGLQAESFRIYEDDRLVSTLESKQTILSPEIAAVHYTLLLVDMSGSVTESGDLPTIIDSARTFADKLTTSQKIAVYAFDGRKALQPVVPFGNNPDRLRDGIGKLESFRSKDPSTNLNGAVVQALAVLDKQMRRGNVPLRFATLVVFTDGSDRAARVTREELEESINSSDHDLFVIGVGAEIDEEELSLIGRTGVIVRGDRAEISAAFEEAAARIDAFASRYYLLGYCSPARAGQHTVRVEANVDGKNGSLVYEFNARGFRPDCDPTQKPRFNVRRPRPVSMVVR